MVINMNKNKTLLTLPREIITNIYSLSLNPSLSHVSSALLKTCSQSGARAKLLINKHLYGKDNSPNAGWVALVQDPLFSIPIAKYLLGKKENSIIGGFIFQQVVLEFCTAKNNSNLLQWMISNLNLSIPSLSRALTQSALLGHTFLVSLLLKSGADPSSDSTQSLCMAAKHGHYDCVKVLVESGLVNVGVSDGYPLVTASRYGHLNIVSYLIEKGADIHVRNDCALHWASEGGHLRLVSYLLSKDANPLSNDSHALRWSCVHGHLEIVRLLIPVSNIHAMDEYALRNAVKMGHLEVVKKLIEVGADVSANNEESIKWAAMHGEGDILKLLIRARKGEVQDQSLPLTSPTITH